MSNTIPGLPAPDFSNRNFRFAPQVSWKLAFLRAEIASVEPGEVRSFFWTAFSETVRESSYTRNGEFKLYRMPADKMTGFDPDVFAILLGKAARNESGMTAYVAKRRDCSVTVCDAKTVNGYMPPNLPESSFDLVITSPPYGNSGTTVAYGQYSRLSAEWVGLEDPRTVDSRVMGGRAGG